MYIWKALVKEKELLVSFFLLAVPIALQNLFTSLLGVLDIIMIGFLGEEATSSVAMCNQLSFLLILISFGIASGSSVFNPQFLGKKDFKGIKKTFGFSMCILLVAALGFTIFAIFFSKEFLNIYASKYSPEVKEKVFKMGKEYLSVISFSYVFSSINILIIVTFRSIGMSGIVLKGSIMAFFINLILNYTLIYGHFGFKAYGVRGAAIASFIAIFAQFLFFIYILFVKNPLGNNILDFFSFKMNFIKRFLSISIPNLLNDVFWSMGYMMYFFAYSKSGDEMAAAYSALDPIFNLMFSAFVGMSNASGVIIGKEIGKENMLKPYAYAKNFLMLSFFISIFFSILLFSTSLFLPNLYSKYKFLTKDYMRQFIVAFAMVMPVKVLNLIMMVGILRAGGDSRFVLLTETFSLWFFGVPASLICILIFKMPPLWAFLIANQEETIKFAIALPRFLSKVWIKNLVKDV